MTIYHDARRWALKLKAEQRLHWQEAHKKKMQLIYMTHPRLKKWDEEQKRTYIAMQLAEWYGLKETDEYDKNYDRYWALVKLRAQYMATNKIAEFYDQPSKVRCKRCMDEGRITVGPNDTRDCICLVELFDRYMRSQQKAAI